MAKAVMAASHTSLQMPNSLFVTSDIVLAKASADSITFGRLPWREVFTDPQLQILIQQALDNNVDMLNAALNVQMAETQLKAARLAFLPQFTFSPSGTIASWDFGPVSKTYQLPVAISWNADLFGNLL